MIQYSNSYNGKYATLLLAWLLHHVYFLVYLVLLSWLLYLMVFPVPLTLLLYNVVFLVMFP